MLLCGNAVAVIRRLQRVTPVLCAAVLMVVGLGMINGVRPSATRPDSIFSVHATRRLRVRWHGQPLITGDMLGCVGSKVFQTPGGEKTAHIHGMAVTDVWQTAGPKHPIAYRREVACNDKQVELAVQFLVPAHFHYPRRVSKYLGSSNYYAFTVPLKALAGMHYQAVTGLWNQYKVVSGQISPTMPDGEVVDARFIAFTGKNGRNLVFDFEPEGVARWGGSGYWTALNGSWRIDKVGDRLLFYFGHWITPYNGVVNSIIRIREGRFDDYSRWHARKVWDYHSELNILPVVRELSFGRQAPGNGWTAAGLAAYSQPRGFGWERPGSMAGTGHGTPEASRDTVHGKGTAQLRIDVPQPGIYALTVRIQARAAGKAIGPFDLSCNGRMAAKSIVVKPGQLTTLTFSRYPLSRHLTLTWRGHWAVSGIVVQAVAFKPEDFAIRRGVWLAKNIPTPTTFYMFPREPPPAKAWVQTTPVVNTAPSALAVRTAKLPPGKVVTPSQDDPALAWRWKGGIGGLGPDNMGSFYEFDTPAKIAHRLDRLRAAGFHTLLLNGLLFRNSYPDQLARVAKTMALIVRLAHARGMKVIDHQDLTIVPFSDAGLKVYVDHLGWMKRGLRTGELAQSYSLCNPAYCKAYFRYITKWVKQTNIDGLMIDEAMFNSPTFPGGAYARKAFYHATGLRLPTTNDPSVIGNDGSRLWRLWLRWRRWEIGNWWVALREHIQRVKPHFVLMKYLTNYGVMNSWAPESFGEDLVAAARGVDFLGTEIMPRNVYANFRSNYAFRGIHPR